MRLTKKSDISSSTVAAQVGGHDRETYAQTRHLVCGAGNLPRPGACPPPHTQLNCNSAVPMVKSSA
jgi:hypothetical protein